MSKQLPQKIKGRVIGKNGETGEEVRLDLSPAELAVNQLIDYLSPQEEKKPCCSLDYPHSPNGCLSKIKPTPHTETESWDEEIAEITTKAFTMMGQYARYSSYMDTALSALISSVLDRIEAKAESASGIDREFITLEAIRTILAEERKKINQK